ncbi:uncharacterized protein [Fopius arisanus]|uniref:Uncharacterized protein n=1 Tax=Fopius arisanus TaxID=64838 RepID=A0A9R1T048_9HYME|nr:PREDICTED: uncharacterized protein LOC105264821 [Fopius arisanus]
MMFEPLLMLTFLNCFFMFSTTVTTCALWLQHKKNHCCTRTAKSSSVKKEQIKKKFKDEILRSKMSLQKLGAKLAEKKRHMSRSREKKPKSESEMQMAESETKSLGVMAQPDQRDTHQQLEPICCGKVTSTEDFTQRGHNSASRRSNRKSTVVMEVSTIQKVVQVIDKERDPAKQSATVDCLSYRVPPDAERRIEFIVQNKSDENSACHA